MERAKARVLIRGAGDLASGVALALQANGACVAMSEAARPLAVRLSVSFAQAVYAGSHCIGQVCAELCTAEGVAEVFGRGCVAVVVDPALDKLGGLLWDAIVDARMLKDSKRRDNPEGMVLIGLGPGFEAGRNCSAAVETNRGPHLGDVILQGSTEADTGAPAPVMGKARERVLYNPQAGRFVPLVEIGTIVEEGELLAEAGGEAVRAPFTGLVRGMLHAQEYIPAHTKIGDLDPRLDPALAFEPSDKAAAAGAGVVRALQAMGVF